MNNIKTHCFCQCIIVICCMASNIHASVSDEFSTSSIPSRNNSYSYVLACGAKSDASDPDGRKWSPDTKFLKSPSPDKTLTATAEFQDPSLSSTVPYMTARILKEESTYSFPVSPDSRHWIRLHFYPSTYDNNVNCSNSFFSVRVGGFTLLNNFSAAITSQALTQAYIINGYSLAPIGSDTLTLTFKPSTDYKDSFVFINGIEVISMPKDMFKSATMVGFNMNNMDSIDISSDNMQSMYRLNVGGNYIPPTNDSTGLSRTWYDDSPYTFGSAFGVTSEANKTVRIHYPPGYPESIAPLEVYTSARSMGAYMDVNVRYNLTWVFRVDANFSYLVRMHFCDYQFTKANQRIFYIYINNQTALAQTDVIALSGGRGVPFYMDFITHVKDQQGADDLWIALHPNKNSKPQYFDAILNGLEIYKINDSRATLAGPNPVPPPPVPDLDTQSSGSFVKPGFSHRGVIVGSLLGVATGFGAVLCLVAFQRRRRTADGSGGGGKSTGRFWLPIHVSSNSRSSGGTVTFSGKSSGSLSNLGLCRHFTLSEIKHATNSFSDSLVIGVGGFGKVYRGEIDGGVKVAIKRSNPSSEQGVHEFQTEIELLSKLRHRHLVSLIGACEENNEMILVYDYMSNGTLREHLYNHNKPPLSWKQRLEICIGAAKGLHYLHTGARYTIIHRDVKTTNILVDEKWVAKVSDFGLSKTGPTLNQTHVSTVVKGSFGYLDPEYFRRQQLTDKSDVYSFGVVLLEVLCARPALDTSLSKELVSLSDWAQQCHRKGKIDTLVDPHIKGEINPECLNNFVTTALNCLSDQGIHRPSMGSVLWNLEFSLQLQTNPDGPKAVSEQRANDAYAMHNKQLISIQEDKNEEGGDDQSEEPIFSQIVNPQGR